MMQHAMTEMIRLLREENAALAAGNAAEAARLLPEKEAAANRLRAALPHAASVDPTLAEALRRAGQENGERLSFAIAVQGRVLELVAHAARSCMPPPPQYGRRGRPAAATPGGAGAQAVALRC